MSCSISYTFTQKIIAPAALSCRYKPYYAAIQYEPVGTLLFAINGVDFGKVFARSELPLIDFAIGLNCIVNQIADGEMRSLSSMISAGKIYFHRIDEQLIVKCLNGVRTSTPYQHETISLSSIKWAVSEFCEILHREICDDCPAFFSLSDNETGSLSSAFVGQIERILLSDFTGSMSEFAWPLFSPWPFEFASTAWVFLSTVDELRIRRICDVGPNTVIALDVLRQNAWPGEVELTVFELEPESLKRVLSNQSCKDLIEKLLSDPAIVHGSALHELRRMEYCAFEITSIRCDQLRTELMAHLCYSGRLGSRDIQAQDVANAFLSELLHDRFEEVSMFSSTSQWSPWLSAMSDCYFGLDIEFGRFFVLCLNLED